MSRYNSTAITNDANGKRRRSSTILPVLPKTTGDTYIVTTSIERLDKLAQEFYDDVSMWWIIAAANGVGKGTLIVPENTRLRIPSKDNAQDILIEANRTR
jgi:hypothetical protein